MTKLSKTKRLAAAQVLLALFSIVSQCSYMLSRVLSSGPYIDQFGDGLTPRERMLVETLMKDLANKAEVLRRLAQRFYGR